MARQIEALLESAHWATDRLIASVGGTAHIEALLESATGPPMAAAGPSVQEKHST